MILIYSHTITNRLKYVTELIFKNVLNTNFELTTDIDYFKNSSVPKIAYTTQVIENEIYIKSNNLLFETGLKPTKPIADKNYTNYPKFFASNTDDFLDYDIFAMVFYFTTRYEEYLPSELDLHQRFKAGNSISFQYNCLQKPFLNQAILDFSQKLTQYYSNLHFKKREFNFISTIDIDNAFAYSNKGIIRNLAGFINDVFKLRLTDLKERIISNLNEKKDPYNTFEFINQMSNKTKTALQYFVLISDYSDFDKNPRFTNSNFQNLLKSLSQKFSVGLHPSYYSLTKLENIEIEKKRLNNITHKNITSARCHFLRINFPETYRSFIKQGITDDYTMIYAYQCGFRTGLCMPYKWFDLERNEQTELTIHTSVIMEGILRDYNQLNANSALKTSLDLMSEVKKYGGEFISIFHNDSFTKANTEWIDLYKSILNESKI